ncbi:MAG: rhodanese-like domain-containing protein [Methylococcales bacterium]|nr:rhodanese-like domain-containing protein [Methylococcales bacterium]
MKIKLTFILLFSLFSSIISAEALIDLSTKQLINMQKNKNALVIDIRTEKEWQSTGTIPGSHKLQFFSSEGKYNAEKWLAELNQLKSSEDQSIILVCRSGGRSGMVGKLLIKQQKMKNIHHLSSGITSWIKAGNKVTK